MTRLFVWSPSGPGDTRGLEDALRALKNEDVRALGLIAKVEGPATINDHARHFAMLRTDEAIRQHGGEALLSRTFRIFSTGCEGAATPVTALFARIGEVRHGEGAPRLVFGAARSADVKMDDRCGTGHIRAAAEAVTDALDAAGLTPQEASIVLVKSPVLPVDGYAAAAQSRHAGSTGSARGAGALGAAIALGELSLSDLSDDPVGRDRHLFCRRAMVFSGTESDCVEALVLGERPGADGDLRIATRQLADLMDTSAATGLSKAVAHDLRLLLFKAGISEDARLRGRRTTMRSSELPADKHLRAAASGAVGAWFGPVDAFISGGAEHQALQGGCIASAIYGEKGAPETTEQAARR